MRTEEEVRKRYEDFSNLQQESIRNQFAYTKSYSSLDMADMAVNLLQWVLNGQKEGE